jgi:hypothetical protein
MFPKLDFDDEQRGRIEAAVARKMARSDVRAEYTRQGEQWVARRLGMAGIGDTREEAFADLVQKEIVDLKGTIAPPQLADDE